MDTKICKQCKISFSKPKTESKKAWIERHVYCSKACMNNSYPSKVEKECLECSKKFTVRNYRKDTARFCSHKCSSKFRDEGKRTEDKKIRQSWAYKKWREAVFQRDSYRCTECGDCNKKGRGKTVELNADHIKPFALFPEERFNIDNGRTLCVNCHRNTETWGRGAIFRNNNVASA